MGYSKEMADDSGKNQKTAYRIDDATAVPVVLVGVVFDIISLAPLANVISAFIGEPILFIIFSFMLGVPLWGKKTWVWALASWVIEVIPFLSILPTFTLLILRVIAISRAEDLAKSKGINLRSEKTKALVRGALQQKGVQNLMKGMEKGAVGNAARRKDGSFDRDKIREKRGQIADRRADLDKALAPNSKGIDGIRSPNNNAPARQEQSANDNEASAQQEEEAA